MTHVATLIAPDGKLDSGATERARAMLPSAGAPQWLCAATAADILFSVDGPTDQREMAERLRAALDGPIDVVVQPDANRRKKLFVADMDSTMIGQECIDELADYAGLKVRIAAITERAMRGEVAFEPALRERVALLKGLPVGTINEVLAKRITATAGGPILVATMRAHGAWTCLVSGGFTVFTEKIAALIGFNESRGNRLLTQDDRLAGTVAEPIFGRDSKRTALAELRARLGLAPAETLAIGDGANDLDMIADAGLGVAYRAKPKVAAAAQARIEYCDLTALLYAQGYRKDEFVERLPPS
jgi:phosphoserine phosphatase